LSDPGLVLVGIPGSGTSTVGALLAGRLGLPLVEVDERVEAEFGAPASEVFASSEDAYREVEQRLTLSSLSGPGVVVTGSGAVDSSAVREALAGLPVVWLRTSVAVATRRLGMNALGMAALVAIRDRMDAMLADRAPFYAAVAALVVDTDRLTPEQVAAAILERGVAR
jgi:shikimate kinase